MPTARGTLDVTIEAEPPFLEQDGIKLNRNMVRKEFSGDVAGKSEAQMVAANPGAARRRTQTRARIKSTDKLRPP